MVKGEAHSYLLGRGGGGNPLLYPFIIILITCIYKSTVPLTLITYSKELCEIFSAAHTKVAKKPMVTNIVETQVRIIEKFPVSS